MFDVKLYVWKYVYVYLYVCLYLGFIHLYFAVGNTSFDDVRPKHRKRDLASEWCHCAFGREDNILLPYQPEIGFGSSHVGGLKDDKGDRTWYIQCNIAHNLHQDFFYFLGVCTMISGPSEFICISIMIFISNFISTSLHPLSSMTDHGLLKMVWK